MIVKNVQPLPFYIGNMIFCVPAVINFNIIYNIWVIVTRRSKSCSHYDENNFACSHICVFLCRLFNYFTSFQGFSCNNIALRFVFNSANIVKKLNKSLQYRLILKLKRKLSKENRAKKERKITK